MAGYFLLGETKVRPGSYFNIQRKGTNAAVSALNGVTAVLFKADFGPLNKVVELSAEDGYESTYGNGMTTDALKEAFAGGALKIIACRLGDGGTQATVVLKDTEETPANAVTITAKYAGSKPFSVTIRDTLADATKRECIIYSGTSTFEKVEFDKGVGEAAALVAAFKSSKNFTATVATGKENAVLAAVSQSAFTAGTDPIITTSDYSNAFAQIEAFEFNTICVDTNDTAVHLLLQSFLNRIFKAGSLAQAVVAESSLVELETREAHAAAFNDEKMIYVLNAHVNESGTELDGYQVAARIAGMVGAVYAGSSLTHTVISGFSELLERLTNTEMTAAEQKGCFVLSLNKEGQVWIDNAIDTLITPADNQDEGWKKIRRVKTRFELIRRVNATTDKLVGKVDNDKNGRATVMAQIAGIGKDMIAEGKLIKCTVSESSVYKADGDSAWFDIDIVDKDSLEHIYLTFRFQYSTNEE